MSAKTLWRPDRLNGVGAGDIGGLGAIAVVCSTVPQLSDELRDMSDRVDALAEAVDEVDGETVAELQSEVDGLRAVLEQLTENLANHEETVNLEVDAIKDRQDEIESRLASVESCFSADLLDQQGAHVEAQQRAMPFALGDERELFIEEVNGGPKPTLRGTIEKVQTFVAVDAASEYEKGDVIDVIITDLHETAAHAAPVEEYRR